MCESEFMKLIKFDLWPSTPTKPSTAISMQLLDQFISLQMEGKISFTSFIDGMSWKSGIYNQTLVSVQTNIYIYFVGVYFIVLKKDLILQIFIITYYEHYIYVDIFISFIQKRTLTRFMQTDSIDQYRQFQRQLRDLWFSDLAGKNFDQCPACPKVCSYSC